MLNKHPYALCCLWLVIALVFGMGAAKLEFRGDYRVYFDIDNPDLVAFEQVQRVFSKSDSLSFMVVPGSDNIYTKRTISALYELTELAWQTPYKSRAQSITNFQHSFAEDDGLTIVDLVETTHLSESDVKRIRAVVEDSPELLGRLVSRSGKAAAVAVTVNLPEGDTTAAVKEITSYAQKVKEQIEARYPEHRIYLTDLVALNQAFADEGMSDATSLIPLMFVVIAIAIWVLSRSLLAVAATIAVAALAVVITLGFAGHAGFFLSSATINVPTVITTLAVADCIHLFTSFKHHMQQGHSNKAAIQFSLATNTRPVVITSVTTAAGFLTMNFSEVPVLADLGNLAALGVVLACALSLSLMPVFLKFCTFGCETGGKVQSEFVAGFSGWTQRHVKRLLLYGLMVSGLALIYAFDNRLNDIPIQYFDTKSEMRQSADLQEIYFGGMSSMDFVISTGRTSGINEPKVLHHIDAFANWLRLQPEVNHVLSFTDTLKRLHKNLNNDDPEHYRIPDSRDLSAQLILMYEMSIPYGLDTTNQLDIDKSATRVVAAVGNLGSSEMSDLERRAKDWFYRVSNDISIEAASPNLMFAHIGEANMTSMVFGSVFALFIISLLLIIALKSWQLGVVSLVPNLLPACIGFGVWGLISGQINLALAVVLSMTLGIIVDDTVHFLSKYQTARNQGKTAEESINFAFSTVGAALITTTAVLVAGFSMLLFSSFTLNSEMGLLTIIIIVSALLVDVLFLPAFLLWLEDRKFLSMHSD